MIIYTLINREAIMNRQKTSKISEEKKNLAFILPIGQPPKTVKELCSPVGILFKGII